jgi:UDP-N-acetylglucosamine--N-acetylmuramyl-(pentapeptide) pyrophosphoryl-undecaprenol N-acetylglucosamine transferase
MGKLAICIAGGRTGGHLFPALAVAESLREMRRDIELYMIGTSDGIEARVAPEYGLKFLSVAAIPFRRSLNLRNFAIPFVLAAGTIQSYAILKRMHTSLVFATGGFPCVPVLAAARVAGTRIFLQEQNSYPGLTTRLFARHAEAVFAAYQGVADFLHPEAKVVPTGNPLRSEFEGATRDDGLSSFGLESDMRTLLVFGGSQGAVALNELISGNLSRFASANNVQLIWQTGSEQYEKCREAFETSKARGTVLPFIDRMNLAYACADLVICRSGALTLAELAAAGKPSILVPYPFAAESHQEYNAELVAGKGAAISVKQTAMAASDLVGMAIELVNDQERLDEMANASRKLHRPGAAEVIAGSLISEIER